MAITTSLDNRIRKINKRVDDAIRMTGSTGQLAVEIQHAMRNAAERLAQASGEPLSKFYKYTEGSHGSNRVQLIRGNALAGIDATAIDTILSTVENVGTVGKSEQVRDIKAELKEEGQPVTAANITAKVEAEFNESAEISQAFEYIYAAVAAGDKEAERLLASMYGTHGTQKRNAKRAMKFIQDKLAKRGAALPTAQTRQHRKDTKEKAKALREKVIEEIRNKDLDAAIAAANKLIAQNFAILQEDGQQRFNTSDLPNARKIVNRFIDDLAEGRLGTAEHYRVNNGRIEKRSSQGVWY